MGSRFSHTSHKCNYNCQVCMETGKDPNIAGRFHIINETECQCNGCNTIFAKSVIYRPVITDAAPISHNTSSTNNTPTHSVVLNTNFTGIQAATP